MPFDDISVGAAANDGTGDTLRATGQKVNANFDKAVEGPASAVDNRVASFDGVTGKLIQDSGLLTTDLATVNAAGTLSASERPAAGLWLPGATGNYASADGVPSAMTDLDIRVLQDFPTWTPASNMTLLSRYEYDADRGWRTSLLSSGRFYVNWRETGGGTDLSLTSDIITEHGVPVGVRWVRIVLDVDNGAGGRTATFYWSNDGVAWTQIGGTKTSTPASSIHASSAEVAVGAIGGGAGELANGAVYRAQVYNGIGGTLVADFDSTSPPSRHGTHPSSFTDSVGNVWTVNGSAWEYRDDLGRTLATAAEAAASTPGVAGGVATLDASGRHDLNELPYGVGFRPAKRTDGRWYTLAGVPTTMTMTAGKLYAAPLGTLAMEREVKSLGLNVVTAGAPGCVIHLGVYEEVERDLVSRTEEATPISLVLSTTIAGDAVARASAVTSHVLPPGRYWLAALSVGGTPVVSAVSGSLGPEYWTNYPIDTGGVGLQNAGSNNKTVLPDNNIGGNWPNYALQLLVAPSVLAVIGGAA